MRFEHIRIGEKDVSDMPSDDDEVVIRAGVRDAPKEDRPEADCRDDGHPKADERDDLPARELDEHGDCSEGDRQDDHAQEAEQDGVYHPTTLEDIESSKMPRMQIAVISVALACLAAFIIWYIIGL